MFGHDEYGPSNAFTWTAQDEANARARAEMAGNGGAPAAAPAAPVVRLPPVGSVGTWLAALVDRDGPEDTLRALLEVVPAQHLMDIMEKLCTHEFGVGEPAISYDSGQVSLLRFRLAFCLS